MSYQPLSDEEFVELGELLANMPEQFSVMDADQLDGYLTGLLLLPEEPPIKDWMPFIFDSNGSEKAKLNDSCDQDRLEELIYRRYYSIDHTLVKRDAIDPIIYEIEDERGKVIGGWEGIAALTPFAEGFLEVFNRWPGLKDHENELVNSALLGVFRHLSEESLGDLQEIKLELEVESPLENLKQALEDLAISVAEIASITRGFTLDDEKKQAYKKKPVFNRR